MSPDILMNGILQVRAVQVGRQVLYEDRRRNGAHQGGRRGQEVPSDQGMHHTR